MSLACGILDTCFGTHFWDTQFFLNSPSHLCERRPGFSGKDTHQPGCSSCSLHFLAVRAAGCLSGFPEGCSWAQPSPLLPGTHL